MAPNIVLASEFDSSKISYNKIKNLDNGGKMISLLYDGEPFALQTPEMITPFGLKTWENKDTDEEKYTLELSFRDMDSRKSMLSTFNAMKKFESNLIENCLSNSMLWLKKKTDKKDVIEALFTPIVRHSKDQDGEITDKYPPTFSFKIPTSSTKKGPNNIMTEVYDDKGNAIDIRSVPSKGTRCKAIITPSVWCAGGKFGCSFRANVIKIRPKETISGMDAFMSTPDEDIDLGDEEEADVIVAAPPSSKHTAATAATAMIDDDDDDEEVIEEDEDEEEFAPPPPTKVRSRK